MNAYDDFDVQQEASELKDRFSVKFDVQEVSLNNFTGQEALLLVIGFMLSQISGGFLHSAGTDAWSLIKRICAKIRNKSKTKSQSTLIKLETVFQPNNCHVILACRLDGKSELNSIDHFVNSARTKIIELQKELSCHPIDDSTSGTRKYELIENKWIDKLH